MKTRIALFRGINVGGRNILPMAALREILDEIGCSDVRTYIQSGNALFRSRLGAASLAKRLRAAIDERFGFAPDVLILDADAFAAIAAANPFPQAAGAPKSVHVIFLASPPVTPDLASLEAVCAPSESFELRDRAFYLHAPEGIARSKLAARVETALGVPTTARNWRTVSKLLEWL